MGFHCCRALPSRVGVGAALQRGSLLAAASHAVAGLSDAQASVAAASGLQSPGSVAVVHGRVRFPTRNHPASCSGGRRPYPSPRETLRALDPVSAMGVCHRHLWASLGVQGLKSADSVGDLGSIPGLGRSPEEWQPIPEFLPGESHGRRA